MKLKFKLTLPQLFLIMILVAIVIVTALRLSGITVVGLLTPTPLP